MMKEHEEVPTTAGASTAAGDSGYFNNNMHSDEMESLFLHDDHPQPQSNGHQFNHPLSSSSSNQNPNSSSFNSFLEPPSYADAMFTSFDSNFHVASPNSASSSATSSYLRISVSDPQKVYDPSSNSGSLVSNNYFYTYSITTRTNLDCFKSTEFSVRRRFSDVVAFSDKLNTAHRGLFIPLRPDKNVVESQMMSTEEFVEQRRVALEKYLRKLAAHPVIRPSEEFRAFLEVEGRVFDGSVSETGVGTGEAKAAGRDFFRMFKELKQSVTNDWVGVKPLVGEDDKDFLERKEKLQDFEYQLTSVSEQAESLVKAQQDIGETMGELGLAFVKLTKFETEEALYDSQRVRAGDMKNIATAAVKGSRLYRELNSQTVKHLDKLHEYLGMMLSVNNAFNDRSNALLTVQTLLSDISSLNTRIEKLEVASSKKFGGDRSRTRRIEELKETIRVTEEAKCCATTEYERIKENNKNELGRLDKEMHDDFLSMLKGFLVNQAGYAEKMANVWETVAEETKGYARESS